MQTDFNTKPPHALLLIGGLAILLLINGWAYHDILQHEFVRWDDQLFLLNNPHITAITPQTLSWMWWEIHLDHWHPLTWVSFAVSHALSGMDSGAFHLVNLLLHSANSGWLFLLGAWLVKLARRQPGWPDSHAWAVGFIAALLFAVHPQHVEVVAWASARKDLLCTFYLLPSVLAYLLYATSTSRRSGYYWYGLSLMCFALALSAKTMAVTLPAVLLVMDFYPLQRQFSWRLVREKIPFFALITIPIGLTILGQTQASVMVDASTLGLLERILNAANSTLLYPAKWLLPIQLAPFYPFEPRPLWQFLVPLLAALAITSVTLALWWKQQQRLWLAAWLFYLITLSPVVGLLQVGSQAAADRYAYLTTLPFYLLAGYAAVLLYRRAKPLWRVGLLSLLLALGVGLGYLTQIQSSFWRDSITLWRYAVLSKPDSGITQRNLATTYLYAGKYELAIQHYRFAIHLMPGLAMDYYNLAIAYIYAGQLDAALEVYQTMHQQGLSLNKAQEYASMGWIYLRKNQPDKAREALQHALAIAPEHAFARDLWGELESGQAK